MCSREPKKMTGLCSNFSWCESLSVSCHVSAVLSIIGHRITLIPASGCLTQCLAENISSFLLWT